MFKKFMTIVLAIVLTLTSCSLVFADELDYSTIYPFDTSVIRFNDIINYLNDVYTTSDMAYIVEYGTDEDIEELQALSDYITVGCTTDKEKCDAVYTWIVNNIGIDYSNCSAIDVFRNLGGVCSGQSQLFSSLVKLAGVRASILRGYKMDTTYKTFDFIYNGQASNYAHEWTMAYCDGEWLLYDTLWDNCGISDVNEMAHWYFPLHCDGIAIYNEDSEVMKSLGKNAYDTVYKDNDYICLSNNELYTNIGMAIAQVTGFSCVRYTKLYDNGYAIEGGYYYNSNFVYRVKDNGTVCEKVVLNYDDTMFLAMGGKTSVRVGEEITNNGLTDGRLNMYVGETIDLSQYYDDEQLLVLNGSNVVSADGQTITANTVGTVDVKIYKNGNGARLSINVYGDIIQSNELFQTLCDHDCCHEVNGENYCDYCGKHIEEVEETPAPIVEEEPTIEEEIVEETPIVEEPIEEIVEEEIIEEEPIVEEEQEEIIEETIPEQVQDTPIEEEIIPEQVQEETIEEEPEIVEEEPIEEPLATSMPQEEEIVEEEIIEEEVIEEPTTVEETPAPIEEPIYEEEPIVEEEPTYYEPTYYYYEEPIIDDTIDFKNFNLVDSETNHSYNNNADANFTVKLIIRNLTDNEYDYNKLFNKQEVKDLVIEALTRYYGKLTNDMVLYAFIIG